MRIIDRKEFITMPQGTIFSKIPANENGCITAYTEGLYLLEETMVFSHYLEGDEGGSDYIYLDLIDFCVNDCGEHASAFQEMRRDLIINDAYERDGLYEYDEHYLIYEKNDLIKLRDIIDKSIEVAKI